MKFLVLVLLSFSFLTAYEWIPICDDNIEIYDLAQHSFGYPFVLACEDGLLIENGEEWIQMSSGLPVWNILHFSDHEFILIQGNGSYSDGIYKFNEYTNEFEIIEWIYYPNFLVYNWIDQQYYVGAYDGLYKSCDGEIWEEVSHFSDMNCQDMVFWDNHSAVSVAGNIFGVHCSDDYGQTWTLPSPDSPYITDMSFRNDSILFGIFPDTSDSSGLWSSSDYGSSWQNEFYADSLSCVNSDMNGYTFVSWEENNGVARWSNGTLVPMNDGLLNRSVNSLFVNPSMSVIHIMALTDRGAYMLSDYQTFSENILFKPEIILSNYPNPFNPSTTITFSLDTELKENAELSIYNLKGQKIKTLTTNSCHPELVEGSVIWNGTDNSNNPVSSGIYYYKLNIPNSPVKKMVLLK
ncbi:T9SS type A sorting domain-containing protein [Candidatus Cloacimonadota bacterium]